MPTAEHPTRCGCGRSYWPEPDDGGQCGVCNLTDGPQDPADAADMR